MTPLPPQVDHSAMVSLRIEFGSLSDMLARAPNRQGYLERPGHGQYLIDTMNFTVIDGDSPYNLKLNSGHYNGHESPFGARVDFMLPPTNIKKADRVSDHAPNTKVGIFLGWELQGGRWKSEYKVSLLEDFKNVDLKTGLGLEKVRIFVTENVEWHKSAPVVYPLLEKYNYLRETIQGIRIDNPNLRTF